ncbi:probable ITR1-Inositol permease [Fusarium fujikuroi]|uniref:Probable ITR1-Inositol permease n=1 Tax=Gibberella fujikuroi (strain CBS 195.34 / IMI 58289 / NRRL A-6831) TaxID=1279085 RepID=S0E5J5_GIBF5|nr:probable ITR1-Inositol permease [Fusarium fujikuroi IMI 58289]KLO96796.1 putative ITR1-Inositol permease [Fusarium fujikuroi]KLP04100.1 putative ITR1-Inositol permease [Fusarium fujikuroi]CCT70169.1 probable ITR1-Inositol permease [Fusarium fujikuroi IMI 58289]SCN82209.1 probable ITR1-Inositol permease [Fusarium fujikuroi]SCN84637.1 probable ITR1-Inositol permease [Fusarium fujikuroi]
MSKADTKEHLEHLEDTGSPNSIHETNINIDDLDSIEQTETGKFSWLISITAAIGGMLFGYDTGIISAVLVYIHQDLGKTLTSQEKELITSITSGGAFLGAIFAGCSADRYGRKVAIYVGCVLFIIGAIIQAASFSVAQMTVGRLIVGFGVGSAAMIIPLYIAECAPSKYRGRMIGLDNMSITGGQLLRTIVYILHCYSLPAKGNHV